MDVKYDELRRCLSALDESAVKRLVRGVLGGTYSPATSADDLRQLQLLLADWLAHLGFLTDLQQQSVLIRFTLRLAEFAVILQDESRKEPLTFALCDYRWISCSGLDEFFDVEECLTVDLLPEVAVTHILCDIRALYAKYLRRLSKLRQERLQAHSKDAAHVKPAPGASVSQSSD